MTEIVYSQSRHPEMTEGRAFQNPRMFSGVQEGVTRAIVVGDHPHIVNAYRKAGVEVVETEKRAALAETVALATAPEPTVLSEDQRRGVVIPDDWRELAWTQKTDGGPEQAKLSLRALASILSDEPIRNKDQAIEVIEAELNKRG